MKIRLSYNQWSHLARDFVFYAQPHESKILDTEEEEFTVIEQ